MVSKEELRKRFNREWEKHYKLDFLVEKGFVRKRCKKCGRFFWTLDSDREVCADSNCAGFDFIGKKTKGYSYVETWKAIEHYFEKHGHRSIARFPVVARWRDDLYFTNASIIDFQPYVVSGELEPIANPLVVPQACLRFKDLQNVGVTGQHYTAFIMFGQHAFNSKKTGLFYWKNEAIMHDYAYLTRVIGVPKEQLCFHEDVWAGGGTFGPSMEYYVNGVELGNCVFMQFRETASGYEELKTKVIDMGAGLERLAWYTNGTATSYDVVFKGLMKKLLADSGISYNKKAFEEFAKLAGFLNVEDGGLKEKKKHILEKVGLSEKEFETDIKPLQALYACADHLKALLYAITDGMLPSNSGGGYNLRILARRIFAFNEEMDLRLDIPSILELHAKSLKKLDETLLEGVQSAIDVIAEEQRKNDTLRRKAKQKIAAIIESAKKGKKLGANALITLYESDGIAPELIEKEAKRHGLKIDVPENFYYIIAKKNEKEACEEKKIELSREYAKTKQLYYEKPLEKSFKAKVLGVEGNAVILDKTLFYPTAGGQEHDKGVLNGIAVLDVEKINGVILHKVTKPEKFGAGMQVVGEIDIERRKQLMRHHTATHLLNASCKRLLGKHVWQAGAHKDADKAHLDITHYRRITKEQITELERMVNELILADIPVKTFFMQRNEAEQKYGFTLYQGGYVPGKILRIVEIPNVDVEACGGTHVLKTGDIGFFKIIKREGVQDGVERLTFVCGLKALEYIQKKERLLEEAASELAVQPHELPRTARRFFNEWKELRKKNAKISETIARIISRELIASREKEIKAYFEGLDTKQLIEIGNAVLSKRKDAMLILGSTDSIVVFCAEHSGKNANEELQKILKAVGGKGGGNERMAVGKAEKEKLAGFFRHSTN